MDEFAFRANINKITKAKAIKYVSFYKQNGSLNEYVFFEHKGVIFVCFLSSMILAQNKPIDHQFNYINHALNNIMSYLDIYLFSGVPAESERIDFVEFIATKILMDLNLIKAIDKKISLPEYSYNSISKDLISFFDLNQDPFEAYINTLSKYNYSVYNILGFDYLDNAA